MYYTTKLLLFVYYGYLPFTGLFAPFLLLLRNNCPVVSHPPLFPSAVGRTLHPGELRERLHWLSLDLEVEPTVWGAACPEAGQGLRSA